jgi:hypothetical protein
MIRSAYRLQCPRWGNPPALQKKKKKKKNKKKTCSSMALAVVRRCHRKATFIGNFHHC